MSGRRRNGVSTGAIPRMFSKSSLSKDRKQKQGTSSICTKTGVASTMGGLTIRMTRAGPSHTEIVDRTRQLHSRHAARQNQMFSRAKESSGRIQGQIFRHKREKVPVAHTRKIPGQNPLNDECGKGSAGNSGNLAIQFGTEKRRDYAGEES